MATRRRTGELGATPIDDRTENVPARVRELAPDGVAGVFDAGQPAQR